MPLPDHVNIKVKGSGQECPLHTSKTKGKIKGKTTRRVIRKLPGSAGWTAEGGCPYMSIAASLSCPPLKARGFGIMPEGGWTTEVVPLSVNVNIKVKGSGQECPLHTSRTKFKITGNATRRLIGRQPGSARLDSRGRLSLHEHCRVPTLCSRHHNVGQSAGLRDGAAGTIYWIETPNFLKI